MDSGKNDWACKKHNALGNTGYCPFCDEDKSKNEPLIGFWCRKHKQICGLEGCDKCLDNNFYQGLVFGMFIILTALVVVIIVSSL